MAALVAQLVKNLHFNSGDLDLILGMEQLPALRVDVTERKCWGGRESSQGLSRWACYSASVCHYEGAAFTSSPSS